MKENEDRELGVIESTRLGYHDGYWTFWLDINFGGSSQGFGGYYLGGKFTDAMLHGVLDATGAECWEQLKGRTVWVRREDGSVGFTAHGPIVEIEAPAFVKHKGKFNVKETSEKFPSK